MLQIKYSYKMLQASPNPLWKLSIFIPRRTFLFMSDFSLHQLYFEKLRILYICVFQHFPYMYHYVLCVHSTHEEKKTVRYPRTRVTDNC